MRDRKWSIVGIAMRHLKETVIRQVVVLGAGFDSLSVEIAARTGNSVASYEVDASTMPYKRRVLESAGSQAAQTVRCVTANMATTSPGRIDSALAREGWDYERPSLVVGRGRVVLCPKVKAGKALGVLSHPRRLGEDHTRIRARREIDLLRQGAHTGDGPRHVRRDVRRRQAVQVLGRPGALLCRQGDGAGRQGGRQAALKAGCRTADPRRWKRQEGEATPSFRPATAGGSPYATAPCRGRRWPPRIRSL